MSERTWSPQQHAIFEWFRTPGSSRNLVVRARAGTGKTTSILEAINYAPEQEILLCAFNKKIAEELKRRLQNPRATAQTLHSLGYRAILQQWRGTRVDNDRGARLAQQVCGPRAPDEIVGLVKKLAGHAKGMAPFGSVSDLQDIAVAYGCAPDSGWEQDGWTLERVAKLAQQAMEAACQRDGSVDFDDMLYVAVANKFARPDFGLVIVDECQDMSATQILLAQRLCKAGGRIAVVGDDRQAIYGFRGADSGSLDRLKQELQAVELPLTITYRCPRAVVALAARLVPDYRAAETAPAGTVSWTSREKLLRDVQPGDAVLSRKNAPLVRIVLRLLKEGRRARMEGRDVGAGLLALAKKVAGKRCQSLGDFLARLESWRTAQLDKALGLSASACEAMQDRVSDQADTLTALCEGVTGLAELQGRITDLFDDTVVGAAPAIVCSSVHRAKGLEWERVFVLRGTLYPRGRKGDPEEQNIEYVAITRAKQTLVWVGSDDERDDHDDQDQ